METIFPLFILLTLLPFFGYAQGKEPTVDNELADWLSDRATVFNIYSDDDSVISKNMEGKRLLIYGEGGSHHLQLNGRVELKLLRILLPKSLNTFFVEAGRSNACLEDFYIRNQYKNNLPFYEFATGNSQDTIYNSLIQNANDYFDTIRSYVSNFPDFQITGIDFERAEAIHKATVFLLGKKNYHNAFLDEIRNTAYLHLANNPYKQPKRFLKVYKRFKRDFDKDSTSIKLALNNSGKFVLLKYLFSNTNLSAPLQNRNKPMAVNLLQEIKPRLRNDSSIFLLEIGQAHARPNKKGTLANILDQSKILKGKILVMNVYCEDCHPAVGSASNWGLRFMNDTAVYRAFEKATDGKGDLVLFDLSELPPKYAYIKGYGDLLLFAKNQK